MFENPRRGRQARNFTTNVPKEILDLNSSSEQIYIFQKFRLGAPDTPVFSKLSLLFYVSFHFPPANYIFNYVLYMNYQSHWYQPLYALLFAATGQFFYLKQHSKLDSKEAKFLSFEFIFILYFELNVHGLFFLI